MLPGTLFPAAHPYSWPIVGSHQDLQAASLEDVKGFFRTYYAPNNLSLVVAGDFDPAEARRLVEKYFGPIAPGPALTRLRANVPRLDADAVVEIEDRVSLEHVVLAWPTPEIGAADEPALTLHTSILSEGLSSRLQKALIYEKQLCTEVSVTYETGEAASMFLIDASVRPTASMLDVERAINAELTSLAQTGPTEVELRRARTRTLTSLTSNLQTIGVGGIPTLLNYYNVYYGDPGKLSWDLERLVSVTPQSVRAVVEKWLTKNRAVLRFRPVTAAPPKLASLDRSKPPALAPDAPFRVPNVATSKLPNGLELFVVERHELPLVSAELLSRAGSVLDPSDKQGLASLVAHAMSRGTRSRNALAIEGAFGDLGATLSTDVQLEHVQYALEVQKENFPRALELLADIVRNPSFPVVEIERERKLQLDALDAMEDDARMLAGRLRRVFSFGSEHPYGRPVLGDRASIGKLSAADASAFHSTAWRPNTSALVLVGDITLAEAMALAQASFGSWSGVGALPPAFSPPRPLAPGKLVIVDKPGAEQTVVVQLFAAPEQKDADYYPLRLASEVLGSGPSGRLYANLRQDKGYSYGVGSYVNALSGGISWHAMGSVQTDVTALSIAEFVKEQRGLAGAIPIEANELENARLGVLRNYAADFGQNLNVANRICGLWSRRWPIEELSKEQASLQRATLKEVQAAAQRYVVPSQASFLLVGDRRKIEAQLPTSKVADVIVVDVQGHPLTTNH